MSTKRSPHDPVKSNPLAALKTLKAKMEAEEAARVAEETKKKEAAAARGEREARPKAKAAVRDVPRPKSTTPEVWRPDLDARLFEVAMAGVVPLSVAPTRVSSRDPAAPERRPGLDARLRRAHAEGATGLQVTWNPDGTVTAVRAGHSFALEALGRFASPEDTCDLHRLDAVSAAARVVEFVRTRRARGMRVVCVIHGQGKRSPDGVGVLRDAVVEALKGAAASADINAFATAPAQHGGAGALMVSLRT